VPVATFTRAGRVDPRFVMSAPTVVAHRLQVVGDEGATDNRQHIRRAWRRAVECWLETHGAFRVVQPQECQPIPA
jgi:hypothetical protein